MIIAVSDVHLGIGQKNPTRRRFRNFLIYLKDDLFQEGGDLVLLGDIFDFWRRDLCDVLLQSKDIIEKLFELNETGVNIHYVVGNHDYYILTIAKGGVVPFKTVGKSLITIDKSSSDSPKFKFMHGYQLEILANPHVKDFELYEKLAEMLCITSGITEHLFSGFEALIHPVRLIYKRSMILGPEKRLGGRHRIGERVESLATSRGRLMYLGLDAKDWFIFGHTHRPFFDDMSRTINTGSWVDDETNAYPFLKIESGIPELKLF